MVRQFVFYLADGSSSWGLDDQISRRTAVSNAMALFSAIKHCNRDLKKDVRDQVLEPHPASRPREANRSLWRCLSNPSNNVFASWLAASPFDIHIYILLNVAGLINFIIDGCARIHEIVATEMYPD